jgi:hypothetical protein
MSISRRILLPPAVALAAALPVPAIAGADGGPLAGIDAGSGATVAGSALRYVTLPGGRNATVVAAVRRAGGIIERWNVLRGPYGIPAVAYDGSAAGLTADGQMLVLVERPTTFPQRRLRVALLDTTGLRVRRTITLKGVYGFDAIAPDGSRIYLIKYASATNLARYAVRAFDVARDRLLARPVVDRRNPDERMRGLPVTRATAPGGRWAYTLYDGGGDAPFVHALDTVGGTAFCIDLDALAGRKDLFDLRLRLLPQVHRLVVVDGRTPLLNVDTRRFTVSAPHARSRAPVAGEGGGGRLLPIILAALALIALGVLVIRHAPRPAAGGRSARR